jgi:hypothetical protein
MVHFLGLKSSLTADTALSHLTIYNGHSGVAQ